MLPLPAVLTIFPPEDVPTADLVPVVMAFLIDDVPVTLVAVLLPVTVLPEDMPLLLALLVAVVLETALVLRPVVLLTLEPPRSEALLPNTL